MTELTEILTTKIEEAKEIYEDLRKLLEDFEKLTGEEKAALPKFKGKLKRNTLKDYLQELTKAIRNPIRFRRKHALIELGITGIENIRDEIFDNNNLEETIHILKELSKYSRLFRILSKKISSIIVQDSITSINAWLEGINDEIEDLMQLEERIQSEAVKDFYLEKYINGEMDISDIRNFSNKVIEIESVLNIKINENDIWLIDDVYDLLNDIEEYGVRFEDDCADLVDAKEKLETLKGQLEEEFKQIKNELDFWRQLLPEIYVPDIKNIEQLKNKLQELKNIARERYKSYKYLEQLYQHNLSGKVTSLIDFANKLEKIILYMDNLNLTTEDNLKKVEKIYDCIIELEEMGYDHIDDLFRTITFSEIDDLFEKVKEIKAEFERLKKDFEVYQIILGIDETMPNTYPMLKQKIEEYKNKLIKYIGKDFMDLIRFLKGEINELNVDEQTLRNFIRHARPLIKEALKL